MTQSELHDRLESSGWWRPFQEYEQQPEPAEKPPRVKQPPKPKRLTPNAKLRQPAYKLGKAARQSGVFRNRNPFKVNTRSYELWDDGWNYQKGKQHGQL
jgi:hypothetical protein